MNSISRNKLFGLGLAVLVLVGGGCFQQTVLVEPKNTVLTECQPLSTDFRYSGDFGAWVTHVEKFPITTKYERLASYYSGGMGEGGSAVLARLLTASDCGEDRIIELTGRELSESMDMDFAFHFKPESDISEKLGSAQGFTCFKEEDSVRCAFSGMQGTVQNLLKVKPFLEDIVSLTEQG